MGAPRAIALCQSFNGALEFQVEHWSEAEEALRGSVQLCRQIGAADERLETTNLGQLDDRPFDPELASLTRQPLRRPVHIHYDIRATERLVQ